MNNKKYNYETFYKYISSPFLVNNSAKKIIGKLNFVFTNIFYVIYPILIINLIFNRNPDIFKAVIIPGAGFILLSLIRRFINRKRPYETHNIKPLIIKDTKGKSMPSRHVFSAFTIAVTIMYFNFLLGIILIFMAVFIAILRVLGGVHYPSDVIAGMLTGIICGAFIWFF